MRVIIIGASRIGTATARKLIDRGQEVVIVDRARDKLENLSEKLDCGMLVGDGTDPDILRDAFGDHVDVVFSLTPEDQDNILACLLAQSLGCERVVPRIGNPQLFALCDELGLDDRIAPEEEVSQRVVERLFAEDENAAHELPWPARLFTFSIRENQELATIADLQLPQNARSVCVFRGDELYMAEHGFELSAGDQVVIVTDSAGVEALSESYGVQEQAAS